MTDRDRLIKLKRQAINYAQEKAEERGGLVCIDDEVDYLLANGVIVPPCKVGDTVYKIIYFRCEKSEKCEMTHCAVKTSKKYDLTTVKTMCLKIIPTPFKLEYLTELGTTIFLTKEEAEARLKEIEGK